MESVSKEMVRAVGAECQRDENTVNKQNEVSCLLKSEQTKPSNYQLFFLQIYLVIYILCDVWVAQWLVLPPHSKKVLGTAWFFSRSSGFLPTIQRYAVLVNWLL